MAMQIENTSEGKIIGIGSITVLPGETREIPKEYETSPVLEVYKLTGMARISGTPSEKPKTKEEAAAEKVAARKKAEEDAERLRQARLASLEGISEEGLAKLAGEIGINMAECRTQADVLKKVKAALKK